MGREVSAKALSVHHTAWLHLISSVFCCPVDTAGMCRDFGT